MLHDIMYVRRRALEYCSPQGVHNDLKIGPMFYTTTLM